MNNRKLFGSELCSDPADKCKKNIMTEKEKEIAWLELKRIKAEKEQIDNYYKDIKGIRKNVQYFFWVSIISIISTILVLLG